MVGVRHGIGDLSPPHAVLDGYLVRWTADHRSFHRATARRHVPEHGRPDFLFLVPPAAPRAQAHERKYDYGDGGYGRADRDAQHFAVNLALSTVKRPGAPVKQKSNNNCTTLIVKSYLKLLSDNFRVKQQL